MKLSYYHIPVMVSQCLDGLNLKPNGVYVDLTFGGGGHSRAILERLEGGRLFGFDQDSDAQVQAQIINDPRFCFVKANFKNFSRELETRGITKVSGILADLGVSSHQIDEPERGFSTRFDSPLDMRMSCEGITAADILNQYTEKELQNLFFHYGELPNSKLIAAAVVRSRPHYTTGGLKKSLEKLAPKGKENKFFAQVFQALRIEVNAEIDALKAMLNQAETMLTVGGRLVVMSYHSLEDRLVKNFMKAGNFDGEIQKDFFGHKIAPFVPLHNKVITPSSEEIQQNPRARSAKLRIAERVFVRQLDF